MRTFEILNLKDELNENRIDPDYHNRIFLLLSHLTDAPEIPYDKFIKMIKDLPINHNIYMCKSRNRLIGMITLIIEEKLIHGGRQVGHIEDLVVDPNYRSNKIASQLIQYVHDICKEHGCYKIILDCDESMIDFYCKNGFAHSGSCMRYNI